MPKTFDHPAFADGWRGCTTEKLNWQDPDYDMTAGTVALKATGEPDSTAHLFFVDMAVRTNDGREIVLERIEGGKLLDSLLAAQDQAQNPKPKAAYARVTMEWRR